MTSVDNNEPERGGDDIVAAEYVLGVLPAAERTAAARRIDLEAAFARLVEQWEGYFAPLAAAYQAVEPPASVKTALDRRLFAIGGAAPSTPPQPGFWSSLALWRGVGRGRDRRLRDLSRRALHQSAGRGPADAAGRLACAPTPATSATSPSTMPRTARSRCRMSPASAAAARTSSCG